MANCLTAAPQARREGHRLRSAESDRRRATSKGRCSCRGFESFVGLYPIPMRHGMTIGELARLFNEHFGIGADLEVVADGGLAPRRCITTTTGAPWVMPSPNIPTLDTAIVYPGTVLFEGTNVSEGRGTTRPFELLGAPGVVAERFADALNAPRLPGVFFRPARVRADVSQARAAELRRLPDPRARSTGVPAGADRRRAHRRVPRGRSRRFRWREPPYEYEHEQAAVRHPRRVVGAARTDRGGCRAAKRSRGRGSRGGRREFETGLRERSFLHVL